MTGLVFSLTLIAESITLAVVVFSIIYPDRRIWPPQRHHDRGQYVMLALFILSSIGSFLLGILDWDGFVIPGWIRIGLGVPLWILGMALGIWSMFVLGLAQSSGRARGLIRSGPYRFSRNPQYVGFILGLVGWAVLANSAWLILAAFFGILPLFLVPFAEEPWLCEQFGAEYEDYMRAVPRFLFRW